MTQEKGTEILRQISDYYGITRNVDFAKFFGLSIQTAFQRMKNGFVDFEQIYAKCPDISPDWMLAEMNPAFVYLRRVLGLLILSRSQVSLME